MQLFNDTRPYMTIDDYILIEKGKRNFLERLTGGNPRVHSTGVLKSQSAFKPQKEIRIRTSKIKKIVPAFVFMVQVFMALIFLNMVSLGMLIPVVILLSAILGTFIFYTGKIVFGTKYNYEININHQFLGMGVHKFDWNDISETLIHDATGKTASYDLVVLTKRNTVFRFSLLNFSIARPRVIKIHRILQGCKKRHITLWGRSFWLTGS
jgi:hypothetical protein